MMTRHYADIIESEGIVKQITEVHPCGRHHSILSDSLPWERAVSIALDCHRCETVEVTA
jgi:hypothetical protein